MFECHITTQVKFANIASIIAQELHWKTSEIKRDPLLGDDSYFYLTSHDVNLNRMISRMNNVATKLRESGAHVVREKIEVIIYDTKKTLVEEV